MNIYNQVYYLISYIVLNIFVKEVIQKDIKAYPNFYYKFC